MKLPNPKDYKKFFRTEADLSCLHSEFLLKGSINKADLFLTNKNSAYNIYLNKRKEIKCLKAGVKLFSSPKRYKKYISGFKQYVKKANQQVIPKYSKVPKDISLTEFAKLIKFLGKFWYFYGITEFPYVDLAYQRMKQTNSKILKKNLSHISKYKFTARKVLNAYFFKQGVIDNITGYFSKKYLKANDAFYLYSDELFKLLKGIKPAQSIINNRKKCYSAAIINGRVIKYSYQQALKLNEKFTSLKRDFSEIKGLAVSPGIYQGKAVIMPMLRDHQAVMRINKRMKKGDILVAETTSPDVMVLCKKAGAIVADQGGMLSHAAVISREMDIPCIIGTQIATQVFKDGDLVEVDANKGLVRKI